MIEQSFKIHFWGIPNKQGGYKNDIWSVGHWPLQSLHGRLPEDHREEYGPATKNGWQWRFDSSADESVITYFTPVNDSRPGEAFFAGSVVIPKGVAIQRDLLQQLKDQVLSAAKILLESRKAKRPSSYKPIQTTVERIESHGMSRIPAETWMFEYADESEVVSICNELSALHHSALTCCFLPQQLPEEKRQRISHKLVEAFPNLQFKDAPDWPSLRQEDEKRHIEAEQQHIEAERLRKEQEEQERIRAEKEALRLALEKEAKKKRLRNMTAGLAAIALIAFGLWPLWSPSDTPLPPPERPRTSCLNKDAIRFTPEHGDTVLCVLPSPVHLSSQHIDYGFEDLINIREHNKAGKERVYILPGAMDVQRTRSTLASQFNEEGIQLQLIQVDSAQALSILFDTTIFNLDDVDRIVLDKTRYVDLPVESISINLTDDNRDVDGDRVRADRDDFPFDATRCGDLNEDGTDDCLQASSTSDAT